MGEQPATDPSSPSFVPVCAIGASAGGVAVLQNLFRLLPDDLGLAYVVVMHLSPDHPSAMHEILAACTRMPVFQVLDGPTLKANCVYVIPPDRELVVKGDNVTARPFSDPRGHRAPIDLFFRSIAAARGDGIAVVLTGAGADGAVGVRAIKEAGGIVMVQEPAEAGFPSMPQNAIATGVADVVAPIARLAERIAEAARSKEAIRSLDGDAAADDLRRIVTFLRTRTGHDFSGYKRATVLRRVMRRMQVCQITSLPDYSHQLRIAPEEARELFADLLISVTMFFRDPAAFEALGNCVVRPLVEAFSRSDGNGELRAWVVGCATGEEAYSLAILMLEEAEHLKVHVPVQIFATDLDEGALATAREGRYPRSIEADVSVERLKRFFVDEGTHYRISRRVRDLVLFATHSVVREPPFMRLDLVTCRNVLIYLERALQQHVCGVFHYGLKPDRFLFLGTAETTDMAQGQFATLDREAHIYRSRVAEATALPILAPLSALGPGRPVPTLDRIATSRFETAETVGASHAAALEASAPPSAIVDADHVVLHLSPTAGRFILLSAGPLSGKLPSIVRPELRLDLRLALDRAFDTRQPSATRFLDVGFDTEIRRVSAHVVPVPRSEGAAPRAIVYFHDNGPGRAADVTLDALPPDDVRHLHGELKAAQEAAIAERLGHEAVQQELRASNEELQSLNEEYRSTAEELETSKEELQSLNEELHTVNAELKSKLSVLSAAHDDLQNLTSSSEIGTLFLDTALRIRMFTPPVAELINLTGADVGRLITDFTHQLADDGLEPDVRRVLRDLAPIEKEVRGLGDRWFMLRVRPYRTLDDRIEGAVITFDDITERRRNEVALRTSEELRRIAIAGGRMGMWRWDTRERCISGDTEFLTLWGVRSSSDTQPLSLFTDRMTPKGRREMGAVVTTALEAGEEFDGKLEIAAGPTAGKWVRWRGRAERDAPWIINGVSFDVTEQHETEKRQAFLLRLSDVLRSLDDPVAIQGTISRLLAEELDVDRAYYVAVNEGAGIARVERDYVRPPSPSIAGEHPISSFSWSVDILRRGECHVVADVQTSSIVPDADRAALSALQITACMGAPLIKAGRLVGALCVTKSTFRNWRESEIELLREVGERIWAAVERARTEATLRESEERFRQFADASSDALWVRDAGTLALEYVSPAIQAIYGVSPGQLLDGTGDWTSLILPDDRGKALAHLQQARNGEPVTHEFRIRRSSDDAMRWIHSTDFPLRDAQGRVVRIGGIAKDVTALKAAETAVAMSEERLQLALDVGRLATWDWDVNTGEVVWNDEHCRMQGYEPGEVKPSFEAWRERVHPDDLGHTIAAIEEARDHRHDYRHAFRNLLSDGVVRWMDARGRFFYDEQSRPARMIGVMEDVTDLKATEVALIQSEQRLRTLVEGVPQLVWRALDNGDWTWASPQWTAFTGQSEPDSRHLGWLEPIHPGDRDRSKTAWNHALEAGGFEVEHRIRRAADGVYRWFQTRAIPLRDAAGGIIEWLGTSTDIDDLRRLQERQGVLVAELQHRTRNLIAVVKGIASDTMRETGPTPAFRAAFADRLSALSRVQGLLSRSEAEPITFGSLLQMELDALGAGAAGVRVTTGGPEVHLRPSTVQTLVLALHELATNARKYGALSHDRGRLAVTWRKKSEAGERRLMIEWLETGLEQISERPPSEEVGSGYGRELIERALPHALGARTSYVLLTSGVRCTIDLAVRPGRGER